MKIRFNSISFLRKVFNGLSFLIIVAFSVFIAYIYSTYNNFLNEAVVIEQEKSLLVDFNSDKFEEAIQRLEKRRNLEDPAADLQDPFGLLK